MRVTPSTEEYLESILRLSCPHHGDEGQACFSLDVDASQLNRAACHIVRPSDIADMVKVSRPSVTTALQRMEQDGLVSRAGKGVRLTDEGFVRARDVLHRHRVAERFLIQVLGFETDGVHEEACLLEHSLSDRVVEALDDFTTRYHQEKSDHDR